MAAWLPSDASVALELWVDPTTNVITSGIYVTQVTDRGPNAVVFDLDGQSSTLQTTTVNSLTAFTDVNTSTSAALRSNDADAYAHASLDRTEFMWFDATNGGGYSPYIKGTVDSADGRHDSQHSRIYSSSAFRTVGPNGSDDISDGIVNEKHVFEETFNLTASTKRTRFQIDGLDDLDLAYGTTMPTQEAAFVYGGNAINTYRGIRDVIAGDWIVYTDQLHDQERTAVQGYLYNKWGSGHSKTDHPHYSSAPQNDASAITVTSGGSVIPINSLGYGNDQNSDHAALSPQIMQPQAVWDKALYRDSSGSGNTVTWVTEGDQTTALQYVSDLTINTVTMSALSGPTYNGGNDETTMTFDATGAAAWTSLDNYTDVAVTITLPTPPTITSNTAPSVSENTALSVALTASGDPVDTWTLTGGADQADFEISGTTLRFVGNGTKDYENPDDTGTNNVYDVQVTATNGGGSDVENFAVTVTNTVEAPIITTAATANNDQGTTLSIALTSDNTVDAVSTWTIVGGANQADFEISGTTLRWNGNGTGPEDAADYVVDVRATNGGGTDDLTITVTVDEVITAPTITSNTLPSVAENATLSIALTATGDPVDTWAITGGDDSAEFEISGTTLRFVGNGTKDYEAPDDTGTNNNYGVEVTATNAGGSDVATFSLNVTNVVELPIIDTAATANNNYNTQLSIALTTSTASDAASSWSIVGGANQAEFEVSGSTLRWTGNGTGPGALGDFVVDVRATNGAGTDDLTITISVVAPPAVAKYKFRTSTKASYVPTTSWANFTPQGDTPANDTEDYNTDGLYTFNAATGVLDIPAAADINTPTALIVRGQIDHTESHNERLNIAGRIIRNSGDGTLGQIITGSFARNSVNPRNVLHFIAIIVAPTTAQQLQMQWKRDTSGGTPAGTLNSSSISVTPVWGDVAALFTSSSTSLPGGATPAPITGYTEAYNNSGAGEITLTGGDTFNLNANNKRFLIIGGNYAEGVTGRTQRWNGISEDGVFRDDMRGYTYYRMATSDEAGEQFNGIVTTAGAAKAIQNETFVGPAVFSANHGGAMLPYNTTGLLNPQHTVFILQLADDTDLFWADNVGAANQAIVASTDVILEAATNVNTAGSSFTDVASVENVQVDDNFTLLSGLMTAGSYTTDSGTRASRGAGLYVDGTVVEGDGAYGYGRGLQGTNSTYGWGASAMSLVEVTNTDLLSVRSWDEGNDGPIAHNGGWTSFWGINIDSMAPPVAAPPTEYLIYVGALADVEDKVLGPTTFAIRYLGTTEVVA